MAWPSIFVRTSSIVIPLISGKLDLYCESIITYGFIHVNYIAIFFGGIMNITWQWRHNYFCSKWNFSPYLHFLWRCSTLRIQCTLGASLLLWEVSRKSIRGNFQDPRISAKRYNYFMGGWRARTALIVDKFTASWMFTESYHSFVSKSPLYILQIDGRKKTRAISKAWIYESG